MKNKFIAFIHWLDYKIAELKDRFDTCIYCGDPGACWCVSCESRICMEHESGYYSDEDLCTECRALITSEEEAADLAESAEVL